MDSIAILKARLQQQQLQTTNTTQSPRDIVAWMGAMQAQDYNMSKWAIGIRIPGCANQMVEDAFNCGAILRTHVLRPTWHLVVPENIRWMLALSKERIKLSSQSRDRELGITEDLFSKANLAIQKALEEHQYLTRDDLASILKKSGIETDTARMIHFMMRAEVEAIVCSGPIREKKQTYALLNQRAPQSVCLTKDEALAKLAQLYFTSHGPATIQDFIWWSGLSVSEARYAIEMNRPNLILETIDSQEYWLPYLLKNTPKNIISSIQLLPAFDEYIISYKNRNILFPLNNCNKAISSNGIFRPTIIKDGQVIGIWKKSSSKKKVLDLEFFEQPDPSTKELAQKASDIYCTF